MERELNEAAAAELTLTGVKATQADPAPSSGNRYHAVTGAGVPFQIDLNAASADGYHRLAAPVSIEPRPVLIFEKNSGSEAPEYVAVGDAEGTE